MATDGWYGNPGWATSGRAEGFVGTVTDEPLKRLEMVLGLQERRHRPTAATPPDAKEER